MFLLVEYVWRLRVFCNAVMLSPRKFSLGVSEVYRLIFKLFKCENSHRGMSASHHQSAFSCSGESFHKSKRIIPGNFGFGLKDLRFIIDNVLYTLGSGGMCEIIRQ